MHDLSQITRPDFYAVTDSAANDVGIDSPTHKRKPKPVPEGDPPPRGLSTTAVDTADSVFEKLTDPRLFTGSHKGRQVVDA